MKSRFAMTAVILTAAIFTQCSPEKNSQPVQHPAPSAADEAANLKIFQSVRQEVLKPTIWDTGDTTVGNEDRLELFKNHVENLGGIHIGVGSFQNFTLATWSKSEWIWLMDFTRIVVAANKINIAFLKKAATIAEFRSLWKKESVKEATAAIRAEHGADPDLAFILSSWKVALPYVNKRFAIDIQQAAKWKYSTWFTEQSSYDYLRSLAMKNHIKAVKGDLSGTVTLQSLAEAARKMNQKVMTMYFSNAEEYRAVCWPCNAQFRANVKAMPISPLSMAIRTVSSAPKAIYTWAPDSELTTKRGFHYNVQKLELYHRWLSFTEPFTIVRVLQDAKIDKTNGFSIALAEPPVVPKK